MRNLIITSVLLIFAQLSSTQVLNNSDLNINGSIKIQAAILDSLHLIPLISSNSTANSLKEESNKIKKYLDDLIDYAEINLDTLNVYTIGSAWQLKFKMTNLDQELLKYIKQINNLPIEKTETEKISKYIDRKSKFKPMIQEGKEITSIYPKESIIAFYKVQYIDIINAEIFFLQNTILQKK